MRKARARSGRSVTYGFRANTSRGRPPRACPPARDRCWPVRCRRRRRRRSIEVGSAAHENTRTAAVAGAPARTHHAGCTARAVSRWCPATSLPPLPADSIRLRLFIAPLAVCASVTFQFPCDREFVPCPCVVSVTTRSAVLRVRIFGFFFFLLSDCFYYFLSLRLVLMDCSLAVFPENKDDNGTLIVVSV